MARQLTQTLKKSIFTTLNRQSPFYSLSSKSHFSTTKPELIEVDLQPPSSTGGEIEVVTHGGLQRLDDAIHNLIVRRLAPDWLPFRPGSSYWVPPRRPVSDNLFQIVGKLTNPLSHEEALSLTSSRGFPSSEYFLPNEGSVPAVEVHVMSQKSAKAPLSEDED